MNTQYRNFFSMGTRLDAVFIGVDEKRADKIASLIKSKLDEIENILSIYRQDSELSLLNRTAYNNEIVVSPYLFNAVSTCIKYYKITNMVFDAGMVRPQTSVVDYNHLREKSGIGKVELDESKNSIKYNASDVYIDSGGFGKGLAIREIKDILYAEEVRNALVSFGESSVLALGSHPQGNYWPVAVTDIFERQSVARLAKIRDKSISTSGTGFVDKGGHFKPAGNIFDPRTGVTMKEPGTVSVISDDPVEAEILSTSLLIDSECISDDYERSGKEAFAVVYDNNNQFAVREIF